jgi:uncharacterized protein (DUF2147 family)
MRSICPRAHAGVLLAAAAMLAPTAHGQGAASPVGLWRSFDATTRQPKAVIRVTEEGGALTARIEKLFLPAGAPVALCKDCEGERKDQPILGMTVLWGLKKDGDGYSGGHVFDPNAGKAYKSKVTLVADGSQLQVLGYVGLPVMGRTQTWVREP